METRPQENSPSPFGPFTANRTCDGQPLALEGGVPGGKVFSDNSRKAFLFLSKVFSEVFAPSPYVEGHKLARIQHSTSTSPQMLPPFLLG